MKNYSWSLCLAFGLFVLINACEAEQECTPGQTKKEDCNSCFCSQGGQWGCTLKACLGDVRPKRQDAICTPGDTKRQDCNNCFCLPVGQWACTLKGCPNFAPIQKRSVPECKEGETTKIECNDCFCTPDGHWACTEKACPKSISKREAIAAGFRIKREAPVAVDLEKTPCAPNDYFDIDCNTCYCKTDKTGYLCTQNVCTGPDHKDILTTSEPHEYVVNKTKANMTKNVSNNNEENGLFLSPENAPSASGRSLDSDPVSSQRTTDVKMDEKAAKVDNNPSVNSQASTPNNDKNNTNLNANSTIENL